MSTYSSYYLYQKYEKIGDGEWTPCTPNIFSISGDSEITMPLSCKTEDDTACGYVPKGSDDYNYEKWEVVDGYICDETTKYARERKYVSDDNTNWTATDIYRRSTTVLAYNSTDCGYDSQWDNYNCSKWEIVSNDYVCNEGNKYQKLRKYVRQCENCDSCSSSWSATNIYKQGDIITYDSTDCGYVIGERMYRWVDLNPSIDYYCSGTTKYYKQQKQVSYNQGQTWSNLNEFRMGVLYEEESEDCSAVIIIYRWVNLDPSVDYYCSGTTKYYKQQKQVSYNQGQTWENVSPAEYQWGSTAETQSTDCGYVPPQYRWYPSGTTCIGYDKWEQSIRQVSYDSGTTWSNVVPTEYSATTLIEADSEDCGYVPTVPIYRWSKAATTDYVCVGYDKHYKEYYQVSYDNGATWQNVVPTSSRTSSDVIEYNSQDCGYVSKDYRWTKTDDTICIEITNEYKLFTRSYPHTIENDREIPCDSSGVLSRNIVQNYYYGAYQGWSHIIIGDCVTEIGEDTFKGFVDIGLPSTPSFVGTYIHAKVPPTLHPNSQIIVNKGLYVPSDSVELYKTSPVWENYADKIIAI